MSQNDLESVIVFQMHLGESSCVFDTAATFKELDRKIIKRMAKQLIQKEQEIRLFNDNYKWLE